MTARPQDVALLPLPSELDRPHLSGLHGIVQDYARANLSAALASAQAREEELRAEVAEWKRVAAAQAELHDEAEARAERLEEALRMSRALLDHFIHGDAGVNDLVCVYDLMTAALSTNAATQTGERT